MTLWDALNDENAGAPYSREIHFASGNAIWNRGYDTWSRSVTFRAIR